jgi:hypothetical protein
MMQMHMYNVCGQYELGQADPLLRDRYMHFFFFSYEHLHTQHSFIGH